MVFVAIVMVLLTFQFIDINKDTLPRLVLYALIRYTFYTNIIIIFYYVAAMVYTTIVYTGHPNDDNMFNIRESVIEYIEYEKECGYDEPSEFLIYVVEMFNNDYIVDIDWDILGPFIPARNDEYEIILEDWW